MRFRFAEQRDAELFAQWTAENRRIDRADVDAATKEQNPTTTFLVIEEDGEPVMFMPVYLVLRIGYLGFNPDASSVARRDALELMLKAVQAFALEHRISTIDVLTKSGLPVAEWARNRRFEPDPRELFKFQISNFKFQGVDQCAAAEIPPPNKPRPRRRRSPTR